jgi:hypothetical protein
MTDDFALVGEPARGDQPLNDAFAVRGEREAHVRTFRLSPEGVKRG